MPENGAPQELVDIEFDVIGTLIANKEQAAIAISNLRPEFMVTDFGKTVYPAIEELLDVGKQPSTGNIISLLTKKKQLQKAGGRAAIMRASREAGEFEALEAYSDNLREFYLLNTIKSAADKISEKGTAEEAMADVETLRENLQRSRVTYQGRPIGELLPSAMQEIEEMQTRNIENDDYGVPTGYPEIDDLIVWFNPGDYIVIAARPGMGKTAYALNLARNQAMVYGKKVGIISLEMNSRALVLRLLCAEARIDSQRIKKGYLTDEEIDRLADAFNVFRKHGQGLLINDSVRKFRDVRNAIEVMFQVNGCDIVYLDYLQLVADAPGNSKYEQVTNVSQMLQAMKSKYPDKIIVALAQVKRIEVNKNKKQVPRPTKDDLKGSGDIEQDADLVLLIHRPEAYNIYTQNGVSTKGLAEMIVDKQRNGPTGIRNLGFEKMYGRFKTLMTGT